MDNRFHRRSMILPGNDGNDVIPVHHPNTTPIPLVVKKPPVILQQNVVVTKTRADNDKEVDAKNFPLLRGFGI